LHPTGADRGRHHPRTVAESAPTAVVAAVHRLGTHLFSHDSSQHVSNRPTPRAPGEPLRVGTIITHATVTSKRTAEASGARLQYRFGLGMIARSS
jgi:hypothetical protein